MNRLLLIALGGAVGSVARYGIAVWAASRFGPAFPFGTLVVNVAGSFLLGLVMHLGTATTLLTPDMRLALGTGVLGAFTTYSTFNFETIALFRSGAWMYATLNVVVTLIGCLGAGVLGLGVARFLVGR